MCSSIYRIVIMFEAAVALWLLGCVAVPTPNRYCDNVSWYCNDPTMSVCLTAINMCVPSGWTCYDNDGTVARYPDPNTQNDPNFNHCGPVMDAGTADLTPPPDLLPPPPDLTPPPDMTPDVHFKPTIQADLDSIGCAVSGCHAVSSGLYAPLLQAMPGSVAEIQNHNNVLADSGAGALSLFLSKPLGNSGISHGGGAPGTKPFADVSDAMYQRWLLWIEEGSRY